MATLAKDTVGRTARGVTHGSGKIVRARLDHFNRVAGQAARSVANRKRLGIAWGIDPSNVSRRTSGESPRSALGAAKADAYAQEAANICTAYMVVEINAAGMQAKLRLLTLAELRRLEKDALLDESDADAEADKVQARALADSGDRALRRLVRERTATHAARAEWLIAVQDEIEYRESRGES